jgi:predicted phosphodiesterase
VTTLAILADIHGNLPALEAVIADLEQFAVDHIIVAGDVINWGPFSAQVVERVVREGWAVIRGNNEFYLLDYDTPREPAAWRDRSQWSMLAWLKRQLHGRWHRIIAAWPDTLSLRFPDAPPIRVVHGSPHSVWKGMYAMYSDEKNAAMLAGVAEEIVIAAHTHLAMDHTVGHWRVLNPGSVGVPLDGSFGASYMLLEAIGGEWRPTFRRIPVDIAPLLDAFAGQRFIDECGVVGHLVVKEFETARLQIHPFIDWHAAVHPGAPFTGNLLDEFTDDVRWDYTPSPYHLNR